MRRYEPLILTCTVLWLSACSTLPRPVGPDDAVRREAAVQTRWVGVTKFWTRNCSVPLNSDWTARPLFPLNEVGRDLRKSARKAKLNRFCVFEYKGDAPVSRQLTLPREISARLRSVEPDRIALSGMSTLQATTTEPFSQLFFDQVQSWDNQQVAGTSRVRLAFLDTQPTGDGIPQPPADPNAPSRSRHGYTLEHIAGTLACKNANTSCTVELASQLAMPVVSFNPVTGEVLDEDTTYGGYRGTFTNLSDAIWAEITRWDNWDQQQPSPRPSHLVLNLSLGWDGEKFGGWEENLLDMSPDIRIVYEALQAAANRGILVIAAAGNERGGPTPTGQPLLPAGWEKPFRKSQGVLGWKTNLGAPLVYAASGVDGRDHPLVNTRKYGEAPRVAYADHVVVPDLNNPTTQYTATLTGTSVAAAVVSTAAAVIWSYQPGLAPADVMSLLDQSGAVLSRKHDFSAASDPPVWDVRRITLCQVVSWAQSTSQPPGPTFNCEDKPEPAPINLGSFNPTTAPLTEAQAPFRPYPDLQDQSLVGPQPAMDPCPTCAIDPPNQLVFSSSSRNQIALASLSSNSNQGTLDTNGSYTLLVELPPSAWGVLKGATLEIFGFDSSGRRAASPLSGSSIPLPSQGDALKVTFLTPAEPFQATLSFALAPYEGAPVETYRSVVSPLFVDSPDVQEIPESSNSVTK